MKLKGDRPTNLNYTKFGTLSPPILGTFNIKEIIKWIQRYKVKFYREVLQRGGVNECLYEQPKHHE